MSGEVTNIIDSGGYSIDLAHVGASDGKYHEFTTSTIVRGQTSNLIQNQPWLRNYRKYRRMHRTLYLIILRVIS